MLPCVPQRVPVANRCQMSFNFNISYHRHQGLLECQTFVTNHALFNASHSIYLFLAQWRLVLSESAVITVYLLFSVYSLLLLLSLLPWQCSFITFTLYHKIHELFYLCCQTKLELQEKLCNKCPSGNSFETAVIVILLAISGFTSNDRAPGGPVTLSLGEVLSKYNAKCTEANNQGVKDICVVGQQHIVNLLWKIHSSISQW